MATWQKLDFLLNFNAFPHTSQMMKCKIWIQIWIALDRTSHLGKILAISKTCWSWISLLQILRYFHFSVSSTKTMKLSQNQGQIIGQPVISPCYLWDTLKTGWQMVLYLEMTTSQTLFILRKMIIFIQFSSIIILIVSKSPFY